MAGYVTRNI
jgi:hypothetical protein